MGVPHRRNLRKRHRQNSPAAVAARGIQCCCADCAAVQTLSRTSCDSWAALARPWCWFMERLIGGLVQSRRLPLTKGASLVVLRQRNSTSAVKNRSVGLQGVKHQ